ncbi:MAG: vWA domain-containing protein [Rhodospirillaceae bacterium]|nr:vWA domain-containing protein [Rhodospirillaceae bacterium]
MKKLSFLAILVLSVLAAGTLVAYDAAAAERAPLLMEGKKTLYQRVLTRPGASLKREPGAGPGAAQPALTRFYVYGRKTVNGTEWLEVGLTTKGKTDGWLAADYTLPWKQQLALAFTNPAGRDRALLFRSREDLAALLDASDPGRAEAPLRKTVLTGGKDPKVLSIEPATYVDMAQHFYLLPILSAEESFTGTGHRVRILEVASVSQQDEAAAKAQKPAPDQTGALRNFTAAVVFVIDSTKSMGPYIDRTREAVRRIYERVEKSGLGDRVHFGLVAFRSNIDAAPALEYVWRLYADPEKVKNGKDFMEKVAELKAATISTPRFSEDSYAGVMGALTTINWNAFGGRYLVLITDAGALKGGDPLSSTKLDAEQVKLEAAHRGVAIYTLHLKTPEGAANHAEAEGQYTALSAHPLVPRPLYYGVPTGSVQNFGSIVDSLSSAIVDQVNAAYRGEASPGAARTSDPAYLKGGENAESRIRLDTAMLGHAMQLAYLGRVEGTGAPPLFRAWIADRDLAQPDRPTTEVKVLLTRNQLSDMQQVLKGIAEAGQASQLAPADFFAKMRSVAATLGRDPNAVNAPQATKLADLGLMGEYLDDLPYRSKVLDLDQETWASWSIAQQQAFLDEVNRKLRLYQIVHDDTGRWVALDGGADPGEAVTALPLDALP